MGPEKRFEHRVREKLDLVFKLQSGGEQIAGLPDLIGIHKGFSFYLELKSHANYYYDQVVVDIGKQLINGTILNVRKIQYYTLLRIWENSLDQRVGVLLELKGKGISNSTEYVYATPWPNDTNIFRLETRCEELDLNKLLRIKDF